MNLILGLPTCLLSLSLDLFMCYDFLSYICCLSLILSCFYIGCKLSLIYIQDEPLLSKDLTYRYTGMETFTVFAERSLNQVMDIRSHFSHWLLFSQHYRGSLLCPRF